MKLYKVDVSRECTKYSATYYVSLEDWQTTEDEADNLSQHIEDAIKEIGDTMLRYGFDYGYEPAETVPKKDAKKLIKEQEEKIASLRGDIVSAEQTIEMVRRMTK